MDLEYQEFIGCDKTSIHLYSEPFDFSLHTQKSDSHATNQDSAGYYLFGNLGVFAIADGAGGHPDGDACSAHSIKELTQQLKKIKTPTIDSIRIAIINSFHTSNNYVLDKLKGSATTLTVCVIDMKKSLLFPFHAGDSYAFVVGGLGKEKFKTAGHSVLDLGLESGLIQKLSEENEHMRHELTNVIGLPSLKIEVSQPVELSEHDSIFICSDGLSDNLSIETISENSRIRDVEKISEQLISLVQKNLLSDSPFAKEDDTSFFVIKKREG